jgi:hypothetical protein
LEIPVATNTQTSIQSLLTRLSSAGVPVDFARKVLPSWWDDEIAQSKSGLQQAQMYFARAFHIDLVSLAQVQGPVVFEDAQRKFKLSRNVAESDVTVSAHFATAMAKLALVGFATDQETVPKDPVALREAILKKHPCVSLSALLSWCADAHIPVLHIHKLPGKKMTGLVVREDGRFAIVLSRKGTPAELLFHLAHELGHIANGHLSENGFVADEKIGGTDANDADEKEADAYAIRLLNGSEVSYGPAPNISFRNGAALYKAALVKAEKDAIDVGHIILNYGNAQRAHALAMQALKHVSGEADGIKVVNSKLFTSLTASKFSEDQFELLKAATGYLA